MQTEGNFFKARLLHDAKNERKRTNRDYPLVSRQHKESAVDFGIELATRDGKLLF